MKSGRKEVCGGEVKICGWQLATQILLFYIYRMNLKANVYSNASVTEHYPTPGNSFQLVV